MSWRKPATSAALCPSCAAKRGCRGIEREVLPACERYGKGVTAWSPLAKGMHTGKYRKGQKQPDTLRVK